MPSKVRTRLRWVPEWEGPTQIWTTSFIKKNQWRCDRIHELKDLEQDAYLIFIKIAERYPRVSEQKHFMALYRSALSNHIHDMSRYMRRKRLVHEETHQEATELCVAQPGEVTNAGYLNALLNEAPEELKLALVLMETEPEKLRVKLRGQRENLNMKLRRILGVEAFDFTGALKSLLS